MSRRQHYWQDLTREDFPALDPDKVVAVLPVAAVEQHGPHLPLGTDTLIAEYMIRLALERMPDDLHPLVLPVQEVGKSNEHLAAPGTLTHSPETLLRAWAEIGEGVHRAGLSKLLVINSHGGNSELIGIVARDLRVRLGMLVVPTSFMRFGAPDGLFAQDERRHGIHAGDMETSLMLHFRPDLVRWEKAGNFVSAAAGMEREFAWLRAGGGQAFAWMAQDLHPSGAMGNAAAASAEKGRLLAEHQVAGFIALIRDMMRFPLSRLRSGS